MRVADTTSIASRIELAFQSASTSTGTSFDYLVKTAARESSFNPAAKAKTSSATGLFQFIESTWLETLKEAGPEHGLQKYSDQITKTKSGKYYVSDPQARREILDLRKDPEISSTMAGALTQKNSSYLERKIGREPTDGELYMAHFLGANGASRLIDAAQSNPDMRADKMFSAQARANKPIFYHRNGKARSMQEVYETIVSKHDAVTMIAEAGGKKDLRTSGELTNVAVLPSSKPDKPLINQKGFDHLAGDPAAAFALRGKPAGPVEIAASDQGIPDLPENNPLELAETTVPLPVGAAAETAAGTPSAVFVQEQTVAAVSADPARASINPAESNVASSRVLSAFQATETANPFEALFRNDEESSQAGVNPRFASAFAAVEEAALFSAVSGKSNQVAAQELALANQGGPLDLTRFLRLKAEEEQKDLLPPA
ncbi:transglycosylase SLT domain-containing protein [Roseibium aggregatum]|uniref:Transglycosylase SLT domain-containing protein n=1 Tax=Roseibium aggregatum TaxID=187304 RepID=A0A939EEG5_9HYPH|nr:transglycosylase SLT domain-containing protein [Roseibium aggregatum]MBN9671047.1 transglycosylase SLT domain-containing protein [Roseibium aggregatum]